MTTALIITLLVLVIILVLLFMLRRWGQRWIGQISMPGAVIPPFLSLPDPSVDPFDWFDITPNNTIHLYCPKIELGQGIHTLVAQIAAAELKADIGQFQVHQPDSQRNNTGMVNITGGSASILLLHEHLRKAANKLRQLLCQVAAQTWSCDIGDIACDSGYCINRINGARLSYGQLFLETRRKESGVVDLESITQLELIGQELPRVDLPYHVTGKSIFGADIRLPNMAYGAVLYPPKERATLVDIHNESEVRALPGIIDLVVDGDFIGVVAERRRQAWQAIQQLDCTWSGGSNFSDTDIPQMVHMKAGTGAIIYDEGRVSFPEHLPITQQSYRAHMCVPLPFESPVTTVDVRPNGVTVYAPTQSLHFVRKHVAKALKLSEENVRVIITAIGGSFARKHGAIGDPSAHAAILSKATNRPVQVTWTFTEDLRYGIKRPPSQMQFRAVLNKNGKVDSLESNIAISDGSTVFPPQDLMPKLTGVDLSGAIGSQVLYSGILNRRARYRHINLGILTSFFRTPGISSNAFAVESFMDELAAIAQVDPIEFRLQHLGADELNQRLYHVLDSIRTQSNWDRKLPENYAHGVACYAYSNAVCAVVIEVENCDGKIKIQKIFACVEAGLIVNPNVSRSQVEGGILMGLGWAAYEQIHMKDGLVSSDSLGTYKLMPPSEAPEMDIVLLQEGIFRQGLNEISGGLTAPALGNAIFALTGVRQRSLPFELTIDKRQSM